MRLRALLLSICMLAMSLTGVEAAVQYTFTSGGYSNVAVDPYFLDPGENVGQFYSYGSPQSSSANTGFEEDDTALVYLTLDDTGNYGLVIVMDRWNSGGGNASLSITGLPANASVAQYDDPSDGYQIDFANGTIVCNWNWIDCCTDGIALNMGQITDFTLNLTFTINSGINQLKFISFDPCSQAGGIIPWTLDYNVPLQIQAEYMDSLPDCNGNQIPDFCDLDPLYGTSNDCNGNLIPDECEDDCNGNMLADECDIATGYSLDCNANGIPDECETDCNGNGIPDDCDIADGSSQDCNGSGIPDECEDDCNGNGLADECDIADGTSLDCNGNDIPDECEDDCNGNGIPDDCDIDSGASEDCDANGVPDECDIMNGAPDCNLNGRIDTCELLDGSVEDCNANLQPDSCDIADGSSMDQNQNGVPDECEAVVSANELPLSFALTSIAPNPFNPGTVIRVTVPETQSIRLSVYDLQGRQVRVLAAEMLERGEHAFRFEARDLAAGVYFAVLVGEGRSITQKMLLLK